MWVCAMKDDMLLILDFITVLTEITRGGGSVLPSGFLILKGVDSEPGPCHATENIMWKVKEHVFGKAVRRLCSKGLF